MFISARRWIPRATALPSKAWPAIWCEFQSAMPSHWSIRLHQSRLSCPQTPTRIYPADSTVLLRLQRPDVLTGVSVERLSALELLARLSLHVPQPYQPLRFCYGAHSNLARHRRAALQPCEYQLHCEQQGAEAGISRKAWRRRWAYLINKIDGENPLVCLTVAGR